MMMRPVLRFSVALAAVLVAGAALADDPPPKTALGKWMVPNMRQAFASEDYTTLVASFTTLAKSAPDATKYPGWADIANRGLTAAKGSNKAGVQGTCNDCHKAPATDGTSKNRKAQYQADANVPKTFP
jgi:hypothetical protein